MVREGKLWFLKCGVKVASLLGVEYRYLDVLQAILTLGDKDLDGRMDLKEFVQFVTEQQRKLWEVFSSLDHNGDGN